MEIERKFLLLNDSYRQLATRRVHIHQAYLSRTENCSVRVRQWDDKAFITIKSRPVKGSFSRYEFEYEIPVADAETLFRLALPGSIDKYRYLVPLEGTDLTVEVDEFLGDNEGLVVAEIELESETQTFPMPEYLGQDVTYDPRYLNSYLATHPFHTWRSRENNTKNA